MPVVCEEHVDLCLTCFVQSFFESHRFWSGPFLVGVAGVRTAGPAPEGPLQKLAGIVQLSDAHESADVVDFRLEDVGVDGPPIEVEDVARLPERERIA